MAQTDQEWQALGAASPGNQSDLDFWLTNYGGLDINPLIL